MRERFASVFACMAFVMFLSGCRDESREGYMRIAAQLLVFNYRISEANFVVTLAKVRAVPEGAVLVGKFENPAGGEKIIVEHKVWPKAEKISLESPALYCIKKDVHYAFEVVLRGPDGTALQEFKSTIESTLDQSALPDKPLVVGPGYEPNPDLKNSKTGQTERPWKIQCGA
jgi:hypothetical protein